MEDDIETKLTAARTWLIIDKPFLGALVLRLPLIAADPKWCKTTATDARALYYNKTYIEALNLEETKFTLAHEALHCALSHFNRRDRRDKHRWDVACDFAINPLLVDDGLKPPSAALLTDRYRGMTAEEIYPCIKENSDEKTLDQHIYDDEDRESSGGKGGGRSRRPDSRDTGPSLGGGRGSSGGNQPEQDGSGQSGKQPQVAPDDQSGDVSKPPPLSAAEREALGIQWQQRLAGAAQQAIRAGKLSGSIARLVDHLLQPQLPWRMLLARYMTSAARTDYSFARPSRREGPAILPSLRTAHIDLVIVLDTSGSVTDDEMHEFLSEINAIKGQLNARITLHACDAQLAKDGPWTYEPWEEVALPQTLQGGGGTRFTPAFEWVERLERRPDLLLYFTDAEGEFPKQEPPYPVIWLVKGKADVPWGQRIQLN